MKKCEYGCGGKGLHQMSSGKWCCSAHWNKCEGKRKRDSKSKKKKQVPWNKGVKGHPSLGHKHSEETKKRMSRIAKEDGRGGHRQGSGRGRKGWYKGFWCDSSYELAFVIWCLEHDIPIERNKERFTYEFEGIERKYIPDFIRTDRKDYYIEIKGYMSSKDVEKIRCFPHKLKIFCGRGIKKYLDYAKEKYGSDFVKLYGEVAELD